MQEVHSGNRRSETPIFVRTNGGGPRGTKSLLETFPDHISKILCARSATEVWNLHVDRMAAFGFERLLYGFTRFMNGLDGTRASDFVVFSNHRKEFLEDFYGRGYYLHEPTAVWACNNTGACSWAADEEAFRSLDERQRRTVSFLNAAGLRAGYTISFLGMSARSWGAIGLAVAPRLSQQDADEIWMDKGEEIELLNRLMHLKILSMPVQGHRALTQRQREVLEWVSEGKTTQDIAAILGLTVATVEKHLRLAREALDAETTVQAVLKAALNHHIFASDA